MRSVARLSRMASAAAREVAAHEREVGGLDGDVGAGADREAEVGLRERGRVVHAVADHGDDVAVVLEAGRSRRLLRRAGHSAMTWSMPSGARDGARRQLVVAGEQDRVQAEPLERRHGLRRGRLQGVLNDE